ISIDLDMPLRVVQRVLETWQATGMVSRNRAGVGRPLKLRPQHYRYIAALLQQKPDMYRDELQLQLLLVYKVEISLPTLTRTLKRMGYTNKKVCYLTLTRLSALSRYPPNYLVFADEAAVNILTTYHINGWSQKGLRARK
ncbi:hypothetical protein GGX14DRAFT_344831, partial [Mycena pura]